MLHVEWGIAYTVILVKTGDRNAKYLLEEY